MAYLPVIIVFVLYFSSIPIAYALFGATISYFTFLDATFSCASGIPTYYYQHAVLPAAGNSLLYYGRLHHELCRYQR